METEIKEEKSFPTTAEDRLKTKSSFDLHKLQTICKMEIDDFEKLGGVKVDTPDGSYIYFDRGASILGVAHRDTVCGATHFTYEVARDRIYTPTLDDRLGCTILLDVLDRVLPEGSYDILLTEGEEQGRSTAKYFTPPKGKRYNWMFQFDRGGTDAVYYQYTDREWMKALDLLGVKLDRGMFSDICYLEHLGICGVNIGTAYYQYHSKNAYCNLDETEHMVDRFVRFFNKYSEERFPFVKPKPIAKPKQSYYYNAQDRFTDRGRQMGKRARREWNLWDRWNRGEILSESEHIELEKSLYGEVDEKDLYYPKGHKVDCKCPVCANVRLANALPADSNEKLSPMHFYSDYCECDFCKNNRALNQAEIARKALQAKKEEEVDSEDEDEEDEDQIRGMEKVRPANFTGSLLTSPSPMVGSNDNNHPTFIQRVRKVFKLSASKAGISIKAGGNNLEVKEFQPHLTSSTGLTCDWCGNKAKEVMALSRSQLVCRDCFNLAIGLIENT